MRKKVVRKQGQFYRDPTLDRLFIVAAVDLDRVALIGLHDGNRWVDSTSVKDAQNITPDEWDEITGRERYAKFELA